MVMKLASPSELATAASDRPLWRFEGPWDAEAFWTGFRHAYDAVRTGSPCSPSGCPKATTRAVELLAEWIVAGNAVPSAAGAATPATRANESGVGTRAVEVAGRRLATKLVALFADEEGGLVGRLKRAGKRGGLDQLRSEFEDRGISRQVAWDVCRELRSFGLIASKPSRPYLSAPVLELAKRLGAAFGVRAGSAADVEAAFMLAAESSCQPEGYPRRLDPEAVAAACALLLRQSSPPGSSAGSAS